MKSCKTDNIKYHEFIIFIHLLQELKDQSLVLQQE